MCPRIFPQFFQEHIARIKFWEQRSSDRFKTTGFTILFAQNDMFYFAAVRVPPFIPFQLHKFAAFVTTGQKRVDTGQKSRVHFT
jgi:hypothetical protein